MSQLQDRSKMDTLFSKESGVRHFVMLGISVVLTAWTYIAFSLISGWDWVAKIFKEATGGWEIFAEIGMILGLVAVCSALVYWCGRLWVVRCLRKATVELFGWLPFVKRLDPEFQNTPQGKKRRLKQLRKMIRKAEKNDPQRQQWKREAERLERDLEIEELRQANLESLEEERKKSEQEADEAEGDGNGEEEGKGKGSLPGCLLMPLTLAGKGLLHLLKALGYLVCSVGIPVLVPGLVWLVAEFVHMLGGKNAVTTSIIAVVLMVIAACTLIVHPILTFIRKPRQMVQTESKTEN